MVDKSRMTLQKLARWHPAHSNPAYDRKGSASLWEGTLQPLDHEDLKQGALYIIKIHKVSVGLFHGWNDDMCCFAVLRSENVPLRWSHARYLPGDFDAFNAFDEAGNPPVHLWTRYLHVDVPVNWFVIFEEARRKQREWTSLVLGQQQQQQQYCHDPSLTTEIIAQEHQPGIIVGGRSHSSYGHYSDLDTFSAAPSQSLRSGEMPSISSLQLPSNASPSEEINMPPPSTLNAAQNAYSPPQSPIAANATSLSSTTTQPQAQTNQPSLSDTPLRPSDKYNTTSSTRSLVADSNDTTHQARQQFIKGSSPPPSPKQLGMALDELTFPHDEDQFSIHSDYQPHPNTTKSPTIDDQYNNTNMIRKTRSIRKMASRSSNITK